VLRSSLEGASYFQAARTAPVSEIVPPNLMLCNSLQGIGEHYIAIPWNRLTSPVTSKTEPSCVEYLRNSDTKLGGKSPREKRNPIRCRVSLGAIRRKAGHRNQKVPPYPLLNTGLAR
jgi:hypothetical protein